MNLIDKCSCSLAPLQIAGEYWFGARLDREKGAVDPDYSINIVTNSYTSPGAAVKAAKAATINVMCFVVSQPLFLDKPIVSVVKSQSTWMPVLIDSMEVQKLAKEGFAKMQEANSVAKEIAATHKLQFIPEFGHPRGNKPATYSLKMRNLKSL